MKRPLIAALAALLLPAAVHAEEPCPRFEVTGTGPDLVLVPGLGSHPETWSIVKESLAKDYRLHLVHVAGFAGRPPQYWIMSSVAIARPAPFTMQPMSPSSAT